MSASKTLKLVDVVNIVHPAPTERNKEALELLVNDKLKANGTWEAMLSKAGQTATDENDLAQLKADAWKELITTNKICIFALLRNLRNIINQAPDQIPAACQILGNLEAIKKSKVLPFRFATAHDEIYKLGSSSVIRTALNGINNALDLSAVNVPKFTGETLVVVDVSGSMQGRPSEIASLFSAMLVKANNCDVMTFSDKANYRQYNPSDSIMTIRNSFKYANGGTNFQDIFIKANKYYDRIIILSDMQAWVGGYTPTKELAAYKTKYNANPYIYSWDLQGYGTLQFPEKNVFALAGFSDKVFDIIKLMETDKKALFNKINSIIL